MKKRFVIFRFNMVEVALALVILAIGLSSVMVLFPVGLRASRASVADNNLADIAERVASYLQAKYTSREMLGNDTAFADMSSTNIGAFVDFPSDSDVPDDPSQFTTKADGMDGLFTSGSHSGYYVYRQYSDASSDSGSDSDRAVDFEAMIRVGWDNESYKNQYYPVIEPTTDENTGSNGQRQWSSAYTRTNPNEPSGTGVSTRMNVTSMDTLIGKFYRTLIIEISWPANAPWKKREKRIFRVEMFNESFVPYPQTTTGGGGGGGSGTP